MKAINREMQDTVNQTVYNYDTLSIKSEEREDNIIDSLVESPIQKFHFSDSISIKSDTKKSILIEPTLSKPKKAQKTKDTDTLKNYYQELEWNSPNEFSKQLYRIDKKNTREEFQQFQNFITETNPKKNEFKLISRQKNKYDWFYGINFILLLFLIWTQIFKSNYFGLLFNSMFNYQLSTKIFREKKAMHKRISTVMNLFFVIVISSLIFVILERKSIKIRNYSSLEIYLFILNIIIIFYVLKYSVQLFIGSIFNIVPIIIEYNYNNFLVNKNSALFIFPMIAAYYYVPENLKNPIIIIALFLIIISIISKFYRWIKIISKKDVFILYSILYLCTLEILPLVLGIKFLNDLMFN